MKIAVVGASGAIGRRVRAEAFTRGHAVTAIARCLGPAEAKESHRVASEDILLPDRLARSIMSHDSVISAFGPGRDQPVSSVTDAARSLIRGMSLAGIRRLVVVGGAGSLRTSSGMMLMDTPGFPPHLRGIARAHADALRVFRTEGDALDWTYVSPPALIEPGPRTGRYRVGADELLVDESGKSHISIEDLAVALLDLTEDPNGMRGRVTVAY